MMKSTHLVAKKAAPRIQNSGSTETPDRQVEKLKMIKKCSETRPCVILAKKEFHGKW